MTTDQQKPQLQHIEIEDFVVLTDRDLSMLGEARHRTIAGRGIIGRLIDNSRPATRRHGNGCAGAQPAHPGDQSMTTAKTASFAHRARATATRLEIAYRDAKRLSEDWYANNHAAGIPFDTDSLDDGNETMPITNMDVYGLINRADELIADMEANNNAKLNTVLKLANLPGDWR